MGGLWARFPHLPPIALFFSIAALGMPWFGNFVGEFLILLGSWPISPLLTILASTGLVFGAVYALILVQRAFHGAPAEGASPLKDRSEEHTSELQSLMRTSYAVFCLKKNTSINHLQYTILHVLTQNKIIHTPEVNSKVLS